MKKNILLAATTVLSIMILNANASEAPKAFSAGAKDNQISFENGKYNYRLDDKNLKELTKSYSYNSALEDEERFTNTYVANSNSGTVGDPAASKGPDLATLSKKAANPISDLWLLWTQNDTSFIKGDLSDDDYKVVNTVKVQPILSIPINNGDWNFVVRPVFQFQSVPLDDDVGSLFGLGAGDVIADPGLTSIAGSPFGRTHGLGDTALLTIAGPNKTDGLVWAAGATQIFPTAADDILGQGKWSAGPAALIANFGKNPGDWNVGLLAQHWWSIAGDDDRSDVNLTDIQYFINYKLDEVDLLGMAPNIKINWEADDWEDRVTLPIGIGYNTMSFMGKLPFRWGVEAQYSILKPDNIGSEFNLRFYFIPIVPNMLKD